MTDETTTDAPEGETAAAPMTFQEWKERLEKCFQFRGLPIPEVDEDALHCHFEGGQSPVELFEQLNA